MVWEFGGTFVGLSWDFRGTFRVGFQRVIILFGTIVGLSWDFRGKKSRERWGEGGEKSIGFNYKIIIYIFVTQ